MVLETEGVPYEHRRALLWVVCALVNLARKGALLQRWWMVLAVEMTDPKRDDSGGCERDEKGPGPWRRYRKEDYREFQSQIRLLCLRDGMALHILSS